MNKRGFITTAILALIGALLTAGCSLFEGGDALADAAQLGPTTTAVTTTTEATPTTETTTDAETEAAAEPVMCNRTIHGVAETVECETWRVIVPTYAILEEWSYSGGVDGQNGFIPAFVVAERHDDNSTLVWASVEAVELGAPWFLACSINHTGFDGTVKPSLQPAHEPHADYEYTTVVENGVRSNDGELEGFATVDLMRSDGARVEVTITVALRQCDAELLGIDIEGVAAEPIIIDSDEDPVAETDDGTSDETANVEEGSRFDPCVVHVPQAAGKTSSPQQ